MTLRVPTQHPARGADAPARAFDSHTALKKILALNPRASLHEIRSFHPALQALSYDQLGLRVERLIDAARYDEA